jgi:hypothetical protein
VLGPLPTIYRVVVSIAALLVFAVAGAWAAFMISYPVLLTVGASIGLAVGAACAYLLVHQKAAAQPHAVRRRRLH